MPSGIIKVFVSLMLAICAMAQAGVNGTSTATPSVVYTTLTTVVSNSAPSPTSLLLIPTNPTLPPPPPDPLARCKTRPPAPPPKAGYSIVMDPTTCLYEYRVDTEPTVKCINNPTPTYDTMDVTFADESESGISPDGLAYSIKACNILMHGFEMFDKARHQGHGKVNWDNAGYHARYWITFKDAYNLGRCVEKAVMDNGYSGPPFKCTGGDWWNDPH